VGGKHKRGGGGGGGGLAKVKWKHQVPYYTECIFNCVGCIA